MPQIGVHMSKKMYKIGEVADLYGVSSDILRHYDKIDLLKPKHIAENGYRYYALEQVFELELILNLRSLDLSLNDIKQVLHPNNSSVDMKDLLLTQADALKAKITSLQSMLAKTERYLDYIEPPDEDFNIWTLGYRPEIYCLETMFTVHSIPTMKDFKERTQGIKAKWFDVLSFLVRSPVSVLDDPDSFEDVSHFSFGTYESELKGQFSVLPEARAIKCKFHGKEIEFDAIYKDAKRYLEEHGLQAKDYVYALDAFGWKDKTMTYLRSDLYIDLI